MATVSFASTEAGAATITSLFNTGVDASGVSLANNVDDPHYVIASVPSGSSADRTVTSADGFPVGPWIGDSSISTWIRPNNSGDTDPVGLYFFETTFDLTGFVLNTVSINGRWATDNSGLIYVNRVSTGQTASSFTSWTAFSIANNLLLSGLNVLDFVLTNDSGSSGNPVGLRVEITTRTGETPLPAALPLFASGLGALSLLGWRRRRKVQAAA
jgi:hypothetical protein